MFIILAIFKDLKNICRKYEETGTKWSNSVTGPKMSAIEKEYLTCDRTSDAKSWMVD